MIPLTSEGKRPAPELPLGPHQNPRPKSPFHDHPEGLLVCIFLRRDRQWLGCSWERRVAGTHFETGTELLLNLNFSL